MDEIQIDGQNLISARRAAELTGYAQDYIGQLARAGKIAARKVGKIWFVGREDIREHKRASDYLRETESQLRQKNSPQNIVPAPVAAESRRVAHVPHESMSYRYHSDESPLLPPLIKSEEREATSYRTPRPTAASHGAKPDIVIPAKRDTLEMPEVTETPGFRSRALIAFALSAALLLGAASLALRGVGLEGEVLSKFDASETIEEAVVAANAFMGAQLVRISEW